MRQSDYFAIRCTPDIRSAVQEIAGPGGFSRAVRSALCEWIERNRKQAAERERSNG